MLIQQVGMWLEDRTDLRQAAQKKRCCFLKSRATKERPESEKEMKVAKDTLESEKEMKVGEDTLGPSNMSCIDQIRSDHGHSNRGRRSRKKNLSDHDRSD